MKTSEQIEKKFGEIAEKFAKFAESLPKKTSQITDEQKQVLSGLLASVMILGWVMDCEDEIKQMCTGIKLAGALDSIKGLQ